MSLICQLTPEDIKQHYHSPPPDDQMQHLQRHQQITVFSLRTGHCRLRADLYRLGLLHTHTHTHTQWTASVTQDHKPEIMFFSPARIQGSTDVAWSEGLVPQGATLAETLWGSRKGPGTDDQLHQYLQARCLHEDDPGRLKQRKKTLFKALKPYWSLSG